MAEDVVYPWSMLSTSNYTMVSGLPIFFMIRTSLDTVYDAVRFLCTGTSMTSFHVAIYRPTSANTLTLLTNLGDVKAQLTGATTAQMIALPNPLEAAAGEIFMIGLLSVGGTQPTMPRSTEISPHTTITTGLIPEYNQITAVSSTGSKTDLTASTQTLSTTASTNIAARIWGSLGTQARPQRPPAFYVDTFNRINSSGLVLPWWPRAGQPNFSIYNNTASPDTGAGMPFVYWVPSIRSDDHYVQVKLGADMATIANRNLDLYVGLRAGRGGTGQCVKLHLNSNGTAFRIVTVTQSYDNSGLTERATASTLPEFELGDVVKLVADASIYSAYYNDLAIASWIDSGVIQPINENQRGVNIATSTTSVADMQVVDNFEAGDFGGGVQLIGLYGIASGEAFGAPVVHADNNVVPTAGGVTFTGLAPTIRSGDALHAAAAGVTFTGYAPVVRIPTVTVVDVNTAKTNEPVPAGAAGCFVTVRGAGGGGGAGGPGAGTVFGGGGGGGGGVVRRTFIPAALLGATYTVIVGAGGAGGAGPNDGANGGLSRFTSGSVTLTGFGGGGGDRGGSSPASSALGRGGSASCVGVTPTDLETGGDGKPYGGTGEDSTYAGAGGGHGGWFIGAGAANPGSAGGDSGIAVGGTASSTHGHNGGNSSDILVYGGGGGGGGGAYNGSGNYGGGTGGLYGGGGGGAGACRTAPSSSGGNGGSGYTRIEWLIE